jgi:VIT1/CCC1 family predicted Fe2+/Mn2+ transporter
MVMTLTILLTARYYVDGVDDPAHVLLVTAIGCNLAWGIIDGLLYVMSDLYDRAKKRHALSVLRSSDPIDAQRLVRERIATGTGAHLTEDQSARVAKVICDAAMHASDPPRGITAQNVRETLASVVLNMAALVPVIVPFVFIDEWQRALDVALALLVMSMFVVGAGWGRAAGLRPWRAGLYLVGLGSVMVAVAVVLGG